VPTRKFWTIFGGSFLAAGLIALVVGLYATYRAYDNAGRLAHEGQIAEGIVLERKIETSQASNVTGGGCAHCRPMTFYRLVYRFTTADGQTFTDEAGVDQAAWDRLIERSPVRIIYVPGAPGINALAGHEPKWAFVLIAPSLGLIFGALGGFVLMRTRRQGNSALASDTVVEGARRDRGSRQRVRKHRFRL
jgi:hypothetical protein